MEKHRWGHHTAATGATGLTRLTPVDVLALPPGPVAGLALCPSSAYLPGRVGRPTVGPPGDRPAHIRVRAGRGHPDRTAGRRRAAGGEGLADRSHLGRVP